MLNAEFLDRVNSAYSIINSRLESVKEEYRLHGIPFSRISFEEIQLDDILQDILLPLTPELIARSNALPVGYAEKCYKVYVATLCELLKNGLVGGGINKTIEASIGPFDLNRHYKLIKTALAVEGIPLLNKKRKYEETLINEAGIPRNYHRQCLIFFSIYWKWLHDYDRLDRLDFLSKFLTGEQLDKIYIFDPFDKSKADTFRESAEMGAFVEKATRTCEKLDRIFSALDSFPSAITDDNLDKVAVHISESLGFNIFTVIRSSELRKHILDYAKKISFRKFNNLIGNFPENESITLPNGFTKTKSNYSLSNYMGGVHVVRGTHYEVTFPCALSVDEIYKLNKNEPYHLGSAVLYTSEEPIYAEENGFEKTYRTFYHSDKGLLYVFYDRIKPASYLYIDDIPIDNGNPFSQKTYISKIWNPEERHYQLYLTIYELFYADQRHDACQVCLKCNGRNILTGSTNQSGSFRLNDKNISLNDLLVTDDLLNLQFFVNSEVVQEWQCTLLPLYIWNKQTGMRIYNEIVLSEWVGVNTIIVFAKDQITVSSIELNLLYEENGYYVYEGVFMPEDQQLELNSTVIPIKKPDGAYIELLSDCTMVSDRFCINYEEKLSLAVHGRDEEKEQILLIEHEEENVSYNLVTLIPEELQDVTGLIRRENPLTATNIGEWHISLFENGIKVSEKHVTVLPTVTFLPDKPYYYEDEIVEGILLATAPCFELEGEYVSELKTTVGKAKLEIEESVNSRSLDLSFFIDRCDVYCHMAVKPDVWALRVKDNSTSDWRSALTHLGYDELDEQNYYVCTTGEIELTIRTDELFSKKEYRQGCYPLRLKDYLINPKKKSTIDIRDAYGQEAKLLIVYPGRVLFTKLEYDSERVIVRMNYQGPIGSKVFMRAFSGSALLSYIERKANYNHFSIKLFLRRNEIVDPNIIVEAKIDEGDFETVCRESVDVGLFPSSVPSFDFTSQTSLIDLLNMDNNSDWQGLAPTILQLLERNENQ